MGQPKKRRAAKTEDRAFFLECVKEDKRPLVSGEDGRKVLEIALRAELL